MLIVGNNVCMDIHNKCSDITIQNVTDSLGMQNSTM